MIRSVPTGRTRMVLASAGLLCLGVAGLVPAVASASTPADSGALTPADSGVVTAAWTGTISGANANGDCTQGASDAVNDHHTFSVNVSADFYATHKVTMTVTTTADAADSILTVVKDEKALGSSDGSSVGGSEIYSDSNPTGEYDAITCAFAGASPYSATVTLKTTLLSDTPAGPTGGTSSTASASSYQNYPLFGAGADPSIAGAANAGEPSIGVDWTTGNVFFQANTTTVKAVFADTTTAAPKLTDVSCAANSAVSLDPILYTDPTTGRTGTSQLLANPVGLNSDTQFFQGDPTGPQTTSCTPSNGGPPVAGPDHQTLGGGAYPKPLPTTAATATSKRAFYYCSQTIVAGAICGRSDNGGTTFVNTAGLPYTNECGGLHGHIRVGPEGNAYLPNKNCNGEQGIALTKNAGEAWSLSTVPGSTPGATDPSVAADRAGNVFFGYVDGDNKPKIAVSNNAGETWNTSVPVGQALGINNAVWAEVIAGDAGRAAFAFVGSTKAGNRNVGSFGINGDSYDADAVFHMYVATTIDGGATYNTVDITPNDPLQRGSICTDGTTCMGNTRNLLDFNDIVVDKTGRVLVGYADGCTLACVTSTKVADNKNTSYGTIARQTSGPLLFVDPATTTGLGTDVPEAPLAIALPILGLLGGGGLLLARRRRDRIGALTG